MPPLRARPTDLPWLAKRFLVTASRQMDRAVHPTLAVRTLSLLQAYAWPGNVRELRNVIDRAVALAPGEVILPEHLPPKLLAAAEAAPPPGSDAVTPAAGILRAPTRPALSGEAAERLRREVAEEEKQRILDALARCEGNQTRAAEMLGVSRRTLINRIVEYDLPRPRKR